MPTKAELEKTVASLEKELDATKALLRDAVERHAEVLRDHIDTCDENQRLVVAMTQKDAEIDRLRFIRESAFNDEPPVFSIIMDEDGFSWQRFHTPGYTEDGWYLGSLATDDEAGEAMPWKELNLRYGPVKVLHRATPQDGKPSASQEAAQRIERLSEEILKTTDQIIMHGSDEA